MIEEKYVSFETATLLKEIGFNGYCRSYYIDNGDDWRNCACEINKANLSKGEFLRPTLYMTMDWLRSVHNVHVEPTPYVTEEGFFWAYKIVAGTIAPNVIPVPNYCIKKVTEKAGFKSCESACESGIRYCIDRLVTKDELKELSK